MPKQWFHNWFNSPYYHLLYNKRNHEEAQYFINNLIAYLHPAPDACLLDVACGRGRHSVYLNKKGYNVTGIDLSVSNIHFARQFENDTLHFFVHDMRWLFYSNKFSIALNLFTSFGYFETRDEHVNSLKNIYRALKPDGVLVLDYFNSSKVLKNLVPDAVTRVNAIDFYITKTTESDKIIKNITFEDNNEVYNFKEAVSIFDMEDFSRLFKLSGFEIIAYFGNYSLEEFKSDTSDRLIFICKKAHA